MSPVPRPAPLRVLLADREGPGRRALASTLRAVDGVVLADQIGERGQLPAALRRTHAEVLVIDDRLLRGGEHVLAGLGPQAVAPRVIVLGVDDSPAFAARARRLGAEAWILKDRADEQLTALLAAS